MKRLIPFILPLSLIACGHSSEGPRDYRAQHVYRDEPGLGLDNLARTVEVFKTFRRERNCVRQVERFGGPYPVIYETLTCE